MGLEAIPYANLLLEHRKCRSSGITDLRHGNPFDEDWQNRDRFEIKRSTESAILLLKWIAFYNIAAPWQKDGHYFFPELSAIARLI
jgi:hypothetical protein